MTNEGGVMTPNPGFLAAVAAALPDGGAPLLVGCKSGRRSAAAIVAMGAPYRATVNVGGGFDAWAAAGLPVEK